MMDDFAQIRGPRIQAVSTILIVLGELWMVLE
jgi:hypothetical protein